MKTVTLVVLVCVLSAPAIGGTKVTYVGQGRYACSGKSFECAQVDQNNRMVSETHRRQYQDEQDRAQAYIERSRREEKERRDRNAYGASR